MDSERSRSPRPVQFWKKDNSRYQSMVSDADEAPPPLHSRHSGLAASATSGGSVSMPAMELHHRSTSGGRSMGMNNSAVGPAGGEIGPAGGVDRPSGGTSPSSRHTNGAGGVALPSPLSEAANYVIEVGRAVRPLVPRDNLDQPLLSSSASQHSLHQAGETAQLDINGSRVNAAPGGPVFGQPETPVAPGGAYIGPRFSYSSPNGDLSHGEPGVSVVHRHPNRPRFSSNRSTGSSSGRSGSLRGSTIAFRQINYVVTTKKMPWSKPVQVPVLSNVTGIMPPGLNAIMGPTGSGKSSLLDVLAARKDPRFLRGEVLVDGVAQPHNFKCVSGYVVQDDIVMGTLTVRENLRFSAALRLPVKCTNSDRKKKVDEVIEELGLTKVADSKIGTELIRGVSGGERKRTNIGMELITDPSVLFLDEPTTGLDAYTAGSVIKTLRNLANRGRTIILSIHQPKYSIYKLFDNLTIVCSGRIVYTGPADQNPLRYFRAIGYVCEAHNSPPDFFMDILHGEVTSHRGSAEQIDELANKEDSVSVSGIEATLDIEVEPETQGISNKLIAHWSESNLSKELEEEVQRIYEESLIGSNGANVKVKKGEKIDYPTGFGNQLLWVSWRTGLNLFRNPQSSVIQLAVYLFFGISIGTVYVGLSDSLQSGIQNRDGLFFFLVLQMVFVNLGAIEVFIKERVAFIHENSSGFYRVSVYFLAKIFCDMLPIKALPVLLFMPIVYWMAGLRADAGAFFFYELNLVLATMAACGVAFFVSASVSVFGIANIIISIIYVFMMVFGGFLVNIKSLGAWLSWCRYFSIFRYAISAMSINEFSTLTFCWKNATYTNYDDCESGSEYLTRQGIPHTTPWDLWCNELGLIAIAIFFCLLCYVQLRRINKYK